jgi:glycosyltransferase involved in cell wall biosynthesis
MHVAHFVHRYPPALGGCEAYVARLSRYLVDGGDAVMVWTSTAIELEEMWQRSRPADGENPTDHRVDSTTVCRYAPLDFAGRRYILKALSLVPVPQLQALTLPCNPVCPGMWRDAGRYAGPLDAVHSFAFPYSFLAVCALRLARRRGVPFLLTPFLHLGDPADPADRTRRQYTSRPLRWLLRQADRVFVQTMSERNVVVQLGIPAGRVVRQGLGVDPAECTGGDRDAARRSWGVSPSEVVVGHLANLSVEKGTVDLLRASERAWAGGSRFRLVLAGPEMTNFRRVWERFPAKHRAIRSGRLTDAEKRDFFAGIDVFALPSRTDSFGLVLLEAWANRLPNVCYRAGGPADLIRDGTDGILVRCGDVVGLAEWLMRLTSNSWFRRQLGEAGRERVGREFRWADKLRCVANVITEVVDERRAAPHQVPPAEPVTSH